MRVVMAITTDEGTAHSSVFWPSAGKWSAFEQIAGLNRPGSKNVGICVEGLVPCVLTVDDSLQNELRSSSRTGAGWTPAVSVASGIGYARVSKSSSVSDITAMGLSGPRTEGWGFGLPVFRSSFDDPTHLTEVSDAVRKFRYGDLDPNDLPSAFDFYSSNDLGRTFFLCLATESGGLYWAEGTGKSLIDLRNLKLTGAGDPGQVISVSYDKGHLCVVNEKGRIFHSIHLRDGSWLGFADINTVTGSSENFVQVACHVAVPPGEGATLFVAGVTATGDLLYARRTAYDTPDPIWSPFMNVKAEAGNPGSVRAVDLAADYDIS